MAQLIFRYFLIKYSIVADFTLCFIAVWVHQFLDTNTIIDYEKRKYDTIFILTCMVLFSKIIINLTVYRDKKVLENDAKKLDNERKKLDNEELRLRNELTKKRLDKLGRNTTTQPASAR